ncbi:MAG TPA: YicC/YloC family endoribonuclease [Terriglobales bacterium]
MPIRSMTGFAQVKAQAGDRLGFSLSMKSVNHRFLDLQLRLPSDSDALEMKLRRLLKEKLHRGHVEVTLSFDRGGSALFQVNQELVEGYVHAFRAAIEQFGLTGEPDLNAVLRMPGALSTSTSLMNGSFETVVLEQLDPLIEKLNHMREEEGRALERELRERMKRLLHANEEVAKLRAKVSRAYLEKVQSRMNELIGAHADPERIMQEAAMLAERSDIQEEVVRIKTHIQHFLGLLDQGGEVGKKLDFLLQELNREANTLSSKTAGVAGEGLRITELGLLMKSEIEKAREQVQNIE